MTKDEQQRLAPTKRSISFNRMPVKKRDRSTSISNLKPVSWKRKLERTFSRDLETEVSFKKQFKGTSINHVSQMTILLHKHFLITTMGWGSKIPEN